MSNYFEDIDVHVTDSSINGLIPLDLFKFLKQSKYLHLERQSVPFDGNGYLYYIGTNKLTDPWKNPSETGKILITASTVHPATYYANIHNVACHDKPQFFYTDNYKVEEQWVKIDLLKNKPIIPKSYSLHSAITGGWYALRNWEFQGSTDDVTWVVLREHRDDLSLTNNKESPTSWDITTFNNVPFRYFRIYSKSTQERKNYFISLGGFEVHGKVHL
jgi:hypothetical protein